MATSPLAECTDSVKGALPGSMASHIHGRRVRTEAAFTPVAWRCACGPEDVARAFTPGVDSCVERHQSWTHHRVSG